MIDLRINTYDKTTVKDSIKRITLDLINKSIVQINENSFDIVDVEFYFNSTHHKDEYTIKHEIPIGQFHAHRYGIDISLGNSKNGFGGILIKGVFDKGGNYLNKSKFKNAFINSTKIGHNSIDLKMTKNGSFNLIETIRENLGDPKGNKNKINFEKAKYRFIKNEITIFKHIKRKEYILRNSNVDKENWKSIIGYDLRQ